jgi:hypothetical protein
MHWLKNIWMCTWRHLSLWFFFSSGEKHPLCGLIPHLIVHVVSWCWLAHRGICDVHFKGMHKCQFLNWQKNNIFISECSHFCLSPCFVITFDVLNNSFVDSEDPNIMLYGLSEHLFDWVSLSFRT